MTQITIDARTRDKLRAATVSVALVDEDGSLVGTFTPPGSGSVDPPWVEPMSLDEMRRRAAEPGGRSLAEILRDLEASA